MLPCWVFISSELDDVSQSVGPEGCLLCKIKTYLFVCYGSVYDRGWNDLCSLLAVSSPHSGWLVKIYFSALDKKVWHSDTDADTDSDKHETCGNEYFFNRFHCGRELIIELIYNSNICAWCMVQVVCHVGHVVFVVLFEIDVISWCQIKHRSLKLSEYALLNSSVCVLCISLGMYSLHCFVTL